MHYLHQNYMNYEMVMTSWNINASCVNKPNIRAIYAIRNYRFFMEQESLTVTHVAYNTRLVNIRNSDLNIVLQLRQISKIYSQCNMPPFPIPGENPCEARVKLNWPSVTRTRSYLRMAISMLKIRRPLGRLIFNMGIAIPGKTVFLIETAPSAWNTTGKD